MECIRKYYRVERKEIAYLRFILEAYDGIALLETIDPRKGLVVLHIPPECEKDVETLLEGLSGELMIEKSDEN